MNIIEKLAFGVGSLVGYLKRFRFHKTYIPPQVDLSEGEILKLEDDGTPFVESNEDLPLSVDEINPRNTRLD